MHMGIQAGVEVYIGLPDRQPNFVEFVDVRTRQESVVFFCCIYGAREDGNGPCGNGSYDDGD